MEKENNEDLHCGVCCYTASVTVSTHLGFFVSLVGNLHLKGQQPQLQTVLLNELFKNVLQENIGL